MMNIHVTLCYSRLPMWMPCGTLTSRAPSQYPKRRLSARSRKVSKPRNLYLELSERSEIWQALRQRCCRCACQISKRYDNLKYQSRGFETSRDLTKRRLLGYWDGAQDICRHKSNINWVKSTAKWTEIAHISQTIIAAMYWFSLVSAISGTPI